MNVLWKLDGDAAVSRVDQKWGQSYLKVGTLDASDALLNFRLFTEVLLIYTPITVPCICRALTLSLVLDGPDPDRGWYLDLAADSVHQTSHCRPRLKKLTGVIS